MPAGAPHGPAGLALLARSAAEQLGEAVDDLRVGRRAQGVSFRRGCIRGVDGLIATPSGARVAEPLHVLVGDEVLRSQLVRRELVALEQHQSPDEITLHEIEQLYGQLKLAFRAHRARNSTSGL